MLRRKLKKVPERVLTYIAWGIARKRFNGKYRRRRWYNKAKSAAITELFGDVAANMPDLIADEIKRSMDSPITRRRPGRSRNSSGRITYSEFRENLNRLNNQ